MKKVINNLLIMLMVFIVLGCTNIEDFFQNKGCSSSNLKDGEEIWIDLNGDKDLMVMIDGKKCYVQF